MRDARRRILVYDGDTAGQMNADRVVSKFLAQDVDLKILTLPDNLDPAEFLAQRGLEAFQTLLAEALEAWEFKYRKLLEKYGVRKFSPVHRILTQMQCCR